MITPVNLNIMHLPSVIRTFSIFIVAITGATAIINGMDAPANEFTYQVAIIHMCGARHLCGGGIIDELHVLTAAHCVGDSLRQHLILVAGVKIIEEPGAILRKISAIHIHEGFDVNRYVPGESEWHLKYEENDIAVLTVDVPYTWSPRIGRVTLPTIDDYTCQIGLFAGWGLNLFSQKLQWIGMDMFSANECRDLEGYHGVDEFCAMDLSRIATTSPGDSGGPLVIYGMIVGIAVGRYDNDSHPQLFANVNYHRDFINNIISPQLLIPTESTDSTTFFSR